MSRPKRLLFGVAAVLCLVAAVGVTSQASAKAEPALRVRKSVTALTAAERHDYVGAVVRLKHTPSPFNPALSYYDQFVYWHVLLSACDPSDPMLGGAQMGHAGPMFLSWHRQFTLLFEDALRDVSGKDITVPYWDWTDPASVQSVFTNDFMGGDGDPNDGYAVTTGPFRKGVWPLTIKNHGLLFESSATSWLTRHFGSFPTVKLPTPADVQTTLQAPVYDTAPFDDTSDPKVSFRNALEGWRNPLPVSTFVCGPDGVVAPVPVGPVSMHNSAHVWVGGVLGQTPEGVRVFGTMTVPVASVNDPVFFLHHANIDRLWAQWQRSHPGATYIPASGFSPNSAADEMTPFAEDGIAVRPADVEDIGALGYRYDDTPSSAAAATFVPAKKSLPPPKLGLSCVL